ncbi:MAG: T9SS type A sorting domain-containing protein [Bacteroidales bacterium]|nr:T9SS type A sorting domain-containing protein [Bacteroidales bacterium]
MTKLTLSLLTLLLVNIQLLKSQEPDTVWTKVMGGTASDATGMIMLNNTGTPCAAVDTTTDGYIYIATSTISNDKYVRKNYGSEDVWLIKLNREGDTIWTRNYGGSDFDRPGMMRSLKDGGCVIVGQTLSSDGDFIGMAKEGGEAFIIRIKADGSIMWVKLYGGEGYDKLYDIKETPDSAYIACGETNSNTGDLLNTGAGLNWVIKVNAIDGKRIWSSAFVGPFQSSPDFIENFARLEVLSDGSGYIVAGASSPDFIDSSKDEIIYMKINTSGKLIWSKKCGSNGWDGIATVLDAGGGAFYIAGKIGASGADAKQFYGGIGDFWFAKFNSDGVIEWEKNYGGNDGDIAFDLKKDALGYLYLCGFTKSNTQDLTYSKYKGGIDWWIIKTDEKGDTIWTKRMGSADNDAAYGMALLDKYGNSFVVAGKAGVLGDYVNNFFGIQDLWVVRFDDQNVGIDKNVLADDLNFLIYPNPTSDIININTSKNAINALCSIINLTGSIVFSKTLNESTNTLNLNNLPQGIYILNIKFADKTINKKIIIQ